MAKAALNLDVEIIGVVSEAFPTYLESSRQGRSVLTSPAYTIADGLAVRQAHNDALGLIEQGVSKILTVSDQEISSAISILFRCTHNVAEGAGAAALAAAVKDASHHLSTDQLGVVLSGGNVAAEVLSNALQ
jgi:threonine dehydratase